MSLLDDIKRALGFGGPERIFNDYAAGAGLGIASLGTGLAAGDVASHFGGKSRLPLLALEIKEPGVARNVVARSPVPIDEVPGIRSTYNVGRGSIRQGYASDIGELAHEVAHAQGQSPLRRALQRANTPLAPFLGAALGIGAGLSGDEDIEAWAPAIGVAPMLPTLVEEGAAAIQGKRLLSKAMQEEGVGEALRRAAGRAMSRKSGLGYLSYLLPALGVAGAGYAAPRLADWSAENR